MRDLTPLEEKLHSFPLRYLRMEFPTLIASARSLEASIQSEVIEYIWQKVCCLPGVAQVDTKVVLFDDTPLQLVHALVPNSRTLTVLIQRVDGANTLERMQPSLVDIQEFGFVNQLDVRVPERMHQLVGPLVSEAARVLRSAYIALEEAFTTTYLNWRFSVFDRIYALTNTHLRILGSDELVGRYWFSVTNLRTVKFRYQFDRVAIERAIAWFKSHEAGVTSPFYSLTFLLVEEANDAIFGSEKFDTRPEAVAEKTLVVPFTRLPHYKRGQTNFWAAERSLYDADAMACIDVVTLDTLSLQLNCPIEDFARYQAALAAAAKDINSVFTEHRKSYEKDLRRLSTQLESLKQSSNWIREITVEIISRYMTHMTKG